MILCMRNYKAVDCAELADFPLGLYKTLCGFTAEKEKAAGFSVLDYWEKQTGRTENHAVSVSENPETLWYPEGSISSASTHLCHRLYCPWV